MRHDVRARSRGFALLMTLWLLIPVAILFLLLTGAARSDGQVAANQRDAAVLQAAADGGIETAILSLLDTRSAAPPTRLTIGAASVALSAVPLSGLVNPNLASPDLLRALMVEAGEAPAQADALAAAITEWRAPGSRGRDGQDKAAQYRAAGLNYGPPGAPFETIGELGDVIGMPPGLVATLRPALSLFADRPPDPALAPPLVRAALNRIGTSRSGRGDDSTVFRIVAAATNATGETVVRSAIIRLAPGPGGRPWSVLAWENSDVAGQ